MGCGAGLWTLAIAPEVRCAVGLDVCLRAVRDAKAKAEVQGHQNTAFIVASATALPFPDGSFDKALSIDIWDNIPDDQLAASEIARVLKNGGKVVVTALLKDRPWYMRRIYYPEHIRNYSKGELLHLVELACLKVTGTFEFYRAFSTLARELADIAHRSGVSRIPGLGFLIAIVLSSLARLDFLSRQNGGGFGVVATKELGLGGKGLNSG